MLPNVQTQIIEMIKNCQLVEDNQINSDSVYDFVNERMEGKGVYRRFVDIASITKWLCEGYGNRGAKKTVTKARPSIKLKPGQKIKIPKPSSNVLTFNDLQRARAVLQQNNTVQLQYGDSEEIDVITPDNHSLQWNSYAIAPQELLNVSTEFRAIRTVPVQQQEHKRRLTIKQPKSKETSKRKRSNSPNENKKEPKHWCNECEKKYQQKSSLLRHQRQVHDAKQLNINNNNNETPITEL